MSEESPYVVAVLIPRKAVRMLPGGGEEPAFSASEIVRDIKAQGWDAEVSEENEYFNRITAIAPQGVADRMAGDVTAVLNKHMPRDVLIQPLQAFDIRGLEKAPTLTDRRAHSLS